MFKDNGFAVGQPPSGLRPRGLTRARSFGPGGLSALPNSFRRFPNGESPPSDGGRKNQWWHYQGWRPIRWALPLATSLHPFRMPRGANHDSRVFSNDTNSYSTGQKMWVMTSVLAPGSPSPLPCQAIFLNPETLTLKPALSLDVGRSMLGVGCSGPILK